MAKLLSEAFPGPLELGRAGLLRAAALFSPLRLNPESAILRGYMVRGASNRERAKLALAAACGTLDSDGGTAADVAMAAAMLVAVAVKANISAPGQEGEALRDVAALAAALLAADLPLEAKAEATLRAAINRKQTAQERRTTIAALQTQSTPHAA